MEQGGVRLNDQPVKARDRQHERRIWTRRHCASERGQKTPRLDETRLTRAAISAQRPGLFCARASRAIATGTASAGVGRPNKYPWA